LSQLKQNWNNMRLPFSGIFKVSQKWNDARYRANYSRFNLLGHNGIDYACPTWTPILAPHKGKILESKFDSGYGNYVKVQSVDEGSVLAHLAKRSVEVGQDVAEGQVIGYSGNSGNSTGPHLHWGYFRTKTRDRNDGFLGYINQVHWLDVKCPELEITDKTGIPLNGQWGIVELQAVRSIINDQKRGI